MIFMVAQTAIDDFAFAPENRRQAEEILAARKSWKTMKGKSEQVWSPQLEQALVEGAFCYYSYFPFLN